MTSNIFADSASVAEGLYTHTTSRSNGFWLEGLGGFLINDSTGGRIIPDNSNTQQPDEITLMVSPPVFVPMEITQAAGLRLEFSCLEILDGVSSFSATVAEHTFDVKPIVAVPTEWFSHIFFDWAINFDDFAPLLADTPSRSEIVNAVHADSFAPLDIAIQIINLFGAPTEWSATLALIEQSAAEHLASELRDAPSPPEHAFDVKPLSATRIEVAGSARADTTGRIESLGTLQRTTPEPAEHTMGVPVSTPAQVERTTDVKPIVTVPLEKTFDVKPLSLIPIQIIGSLRFTTPTFPIEFRGTMVVSTLEAVEALLGVRSTAVPPLEHLGGIAATTPVMDDQKGTMARDTPEVGERLGTELALSAAPLERGLGIGGPGVKIPTEHVSLIRVDRAEAVEFRAWLQSNTAALVEELSRIRQDAPGSLEHTATVTGLTPSKAAYSGTLAASTPIPAALMSGIASAVAAVVERLTPVRVDSKNRVEWRGALLVDLPSRIDRTGTILTDAPARIEITMQVHDDSGIPIAFYGYALIGQQALQGSKVTVQLEGTKQTTELQGSKVEVLLVGSVKT